MNELFRIVIRVTTLSGRVLPPRTIGIRAPSERDAHIVATGICQLLEGTPLARPDVTVEGAPTDPVALAVADETDMTLEEAVVLAVTGQWAA